MPSNPQTGQYNVEGGMPQLPICEADMASFTRELQAWIVKNFSQIYAALAAKEYQSHDVCEQLGLLAPDDCLIAVADIDQTCFEYATTASQVILPGSCVLPYLAEIPQQHYSAGGKIQGKDDTLPQSITPIPDTIGVNFGVLLSPGNDVRIVLESPNEQRRNSGNDDRIGISCHNLNNEPGSVWAYWLAIPFA